MTIFLQSDTVIDGENKVRLREIENLYIDEDNHHQQQDRRRRHQMFSDPVDHMCEFLQAAQCPVS